MAWNFPFMIFNFPPLFSHSKIIRMSTLIIILITYLSLIIIIIIITKSRNSYCSVGVMELCLLNFLILLIVFCVILTLVCSLRACHMWLTRNHIFIREIWKKFERFQNFKKVNLVNLSQISLLNVITSTNSS